MKKMFTEIDRERIRQFAADITPKTWNIVLTPKEDKLEPGTLNILLSFKASQYEVYSDGRGQTCYSDERGIEICRRMIPGGMLFMDLFDIGIDRKGKVAQIVVQLWPQYQQMKKVLLQELARVAVIRRRAWEVRAYKQAGPVVVKENLVCERNVRLTLDKALSLFTQRAIRHHGDNYLEHKMV